MTSSIAAGLAQGLAQGLELGDQMALRRAALDRQDRVDAQAEQEQAFSQGLRGQALRLQQDQLAEQTRQAQAREGQSERQIGIAAQALGLDESKFKQTQQQQAFENQVTSEKLGRERALFPLQQQGAELELAKARQAQAETEKALAVRKSMNILTQMQGGLIDPNSAEDYYQTLKTATGIDPMGFADGQVNGLLRTFTAVHDGKLDPNAPEALDAANGMFGARLQRGIGDRIDLPGVQAVGADGKPVAGVKGEVVDKRLSRVIPVPDDAGNPSGRFVFGVASTVKAPDGKLYTYEAPLSLYGTSHPDDPALVLDGNDVSGHAAALLQIQHRYLTDPKFKAGFDTMLVGRTPPKEAAEIELKQAEATNKRAEAVKHLAEAGTHDKVLKSVHDLLNKRFAADSLEGVAKDQRELMDQSRVLAGKYRARYPNATAEQIYGAVVRDLGGGQSKDSGDYQEGEVYQDGQGNQAVYKGGKWVDLP